MGLLGKLLIGDFSLMVQNLSKVRMETAVDRHLLVESVSVLRTAFKSCIMSRNRSRFRLARFFSASLITFNSSFFFFFRAIFFNLVSVNRVSCEDCHVRRQGISTKASLANYNESSNATACRRALFKVEVIGRMKKVQ